MYIWVVLATFIAILYGFKLSVRSDMRQIYVEPQAEAAVSKIVIQHKAAVKYIGDLVSDKKPYNAGEISTNVFEAYLPAGYNSTGTYTTIMYCLDKNDKTLSTANGNCNAENSINYLVTFGCVPQRWKSIKGGRPANDLVNAMKTVVGNASNFGYTQEISKTADKNQLGSTMGINNGNNQWLSIPQYIIDNAGGEGKKSFAKECGPKGICSYCMVYMTPFDQL